MKEQMYKILKSKKLVINNYIIRVAKEKDLNLNEFLVLVYFDNSFSNKFDVELVCETLGLENNDILEAFNSLMLIAEPSLSTR